MTGETAVGDLLDRLSGEDRDCVGDRFGESGYEAVAATTLAGLFGDVATAGRLLECFEVESSRGLALVEAQDGGLTPETRLCLVGLSFDHPELFALRIGVPLDALAVDHLELHERFLDIYDCMTSLEQLVLTTRIQVGLDIADPMTVRDVEPAFTEDEVSCISGAIDDWESLLDSSLAALSGPEFSAAGMECIELSDLADVRARLFGATFLAKATDGVSQESLGCLANFAGERPDFQQAFYSMPLEEFAATRDPAVFEANLDLYAEAAQDATLLLDCLSDDELRQFQQRIPPALLAFQSHPATAE